MMPGPTCTRWPSGLSTLGVLGCLARLLQAVLLALLLAGIPSEQAGPLQDRPQLRIDFDQPSCNPEPERPRLPGDPAAGDRGIDVVAFGGVGDPQRIGRSHPVRRRGEVLLERPLVHPDHASARANPNPCNGFLAPPGRLAKR